MVAQLGNLSNTICRVCAAELEVEGERVGGK